MPRSHRLFLALWPDAEIRSRLAAHARGWTLPPGCLRYPPPDWHVTLHYIGAVATEQVAALAAGVAVPAMRFELVLDRPQVWPRGLAVLGATEVPAAMESLHRRLGDALQAADREIELRSYRPHVTLARRAAAALPPLEPQPVAWSVRQFVLALSTGKATPRYEIIRAYGE
jgi:2'-5' RNA ligase